MNIKVAACIVAVGSLGTGAVVVADNGINLYTTEGQTLQRTIESPIPESGMNSMIADQTEPKVTLERFDGEVSMDVKYLGIKAKGERKFLTNKIEWSDAKQTMELVPTEEGYEINVVLKEKPISNVFEFGIDTDNLDFFYQPELTKQEIKEGAFRPENVIGSYAVYYRNHKDHIEGQTNYATGKAFHIYRPQIIDAKGKTTWGELSYEDDILSVTVPQKFLDTAAYPVTVDPTFGYTTLGAGLFLIGSGAGVNVRRGNGWSIPENGTLTKITAGMSMSSGAQTGNVSTFVNIENTVTDSLTQVATIETSQSITTSAAFFDFTAASQYISTGSYVLNVVSDGSAFTNGVNIRYDTLTARNVYAENFASYAASKESPWTVTDSSLTTTLSIYATYSAS